MWREAISNDTGINSKIPLFKEREDRFKEEVEEMSLKKRKQIL
jgi:hypothetical protein